MRIPISCTAFGLALAAAAPAAHAQTVVTQPVQTIRTTTTTQYVRPISRHRVVVTRRTTVTQRVVPRARTLYDVVPAPRAVYEVAPPPATVVVTTPRYSRPLYDEVVAPVDAPVPPPVGAAVPFYRYVYEPDRILVIDPNTNIAVEAIPR